MPLLAFGTVEPPFTAFRFEVVLNLDTPLPGVTNPVCNAAFAECDGLEMTMEPKAVREGGNNQEQIHLIGPISYSQLTLKRGMTTNLQLWSWFAAAGQTGRRSTAQGQVTLWDAAGQPQVTFLLADCLPVKLRGPSLNAKDGQITIEEMQLVYSRLSVRLAGVAGVGSRLGASNRVSGGPGLSSGSASAGLDIG
jgi:phage tail-like protein